MAEPGFGAANSLSGFLFKPRAVGDYASLVTNTPKTAFEDEDDDEYEDERSLAGRLATLFYMTYIV